jgi:hypothetical protein
VVAATSEHGRRVHNMTATREQILAMAVPPLVAEPAAAAQPDRSDLGGDLPGS